MIAKWISVALLIPILGGGLAEANRLHRAGQHREAAAAYARLMERGDTSAAVRYNLGTAILRADSFDAARPHLEAAADARSRLPAGLRERAHYNAGNADLQPVFLRRAPETERAERLRRSIDRYKRALLIDPADFDARWNLELAQRLLREEEKNPQSGGGGGGEGGPQDPTPADRPPQPAPGSPSGPAPQVTSAEAERILSQAEERERRTQRQALERNRGRVRETPVRDW